MLSAEIKNLKAWGVAHRRYLHQHPELSLQEHNTSEYCQKVLSDLGYHLTPLFGYGFRADLTIPNATKRIAFRAEMDALPVLEKNTHGFVSRHPGVAHVCGHDVHMSVALLTAKILQAHAADLNVNVRFIFQPSEEELPGGALGMIKASCLQGVDEIYGLYILAQAKTGEIWIREGVLMGTSSPFKLKITGKGCHAAKPEEGLNPISAAATLIPVWHDLPQALKAMHAPILSVTQIEAGSVNDVIPETATLMGALRAFSQKDLAEMQREMQTSPKALQKQGYRTELTFEESYHCVVNGAYGMQRVLDAAAQVPGLQVRQDIAPMCFVEDFCYYLEACPGAFYFLGGGNSVLNIVHPLHSPYYDVDEDALIFGTELMSLLALNMR